MLWFRTLSWFNELWDIDLTLRSLWFSVGLWLGNFGRFESAGFVLWLRSCWVVSTWIDVLIWWLYIKNWTSGSFHIWGSLHIDYFGRCLIINGINDCLWTWVWKILFLKAWIFPILVSFRDVCTEVHFLLKFRLWLIVRLVFNTFLRVLNLV